MPGIAMLMQGLEMPSKEIFDKVKVRGLVKLSSDRDQITLLCSKDKKITERLESPPQYQKVYIPLVRRINQIKDRNLDKIAENISLDIAKASEMYMKNRVCQVNAFLAYGITDKFVYLMPHSEEEVVNYYFRGEPLPKKHLDCYLYLLQFFKIGKELADGKGIML
jgi:hypothetical protein